MSGSKKSSASRMDRYVPVAAAMPRLRAAPAPSVSSVWRRIFMRGSLLAASSKMDSDASAEPSSTQMISISRSVCEKTLASAFFKYFSELQTAMTTDTLGSGMPFSPPCNHIFRNSQMIFSGWMPIPIRYDRMPRNVATDSTATTTTSKPPCRSVSGSRTGNPIRS